MRLHSTSALTAAIVVAALAGLVASSGPARADWLQPDPSYRDAQLELRAALRDTVGQGANPARLDTLGVALLRLGRFADAQRIFARTAELRPGDEAAAAGLGKLALFHGRLAEAESLLTIGTAADPTAPLDLLAAHVRRGGYAVAAAMAESLGMTGRAEMLRGMADAAPYAISGDAEASLMFARNYPVALVRVKLNGQYVLMAVDPGAGDLVIDERAAKQAGVTLLPSETPVLWSGTRIAARNAMVQRVELGGIRVEHVPAGVVSLRRWSLEANPQGERLAGVIGLNLLRRFTPTLDYRNMRLELRPLGASIASTPGAVRVPFELWGEHELTVYGTIGGGRRMAMVIQASIPACGVAAPSEVFQELGIKPGMVSRMVKGAGRALQGRGWGAVTVSAVTVGPVVKDKLDGWSGAFDSAELWRHGVRRDVALGGDFFRDWRMTIDWDRQELIFERP